jgi:hypothetical protein
MSSFNDQNEIGSLPVKSNPLEETLHQAMRPCSHALILFVKMRSYDLVEDRSAKMKMETSSRPKHGLRTRLRSSLLLPAHSSQQHDTDASPLALIRLILRVDTAIDRLRPPIVQIVMQLAIASAELQLFQE